MVSKALLSPILDDDNLTRGLNDPEARVLVEWLVERTESLAGDSRAGGEAPFRVGSWCRRARALARFVQLWCYDHDHGGACQLAATERFAWPFPAADVDPYDLMVNILGWEMDNT